MRTTTPVLAALILAMMSNGPALAAPPSPDITIAVVDDPDQLNEHVNTLSLPAATQVKGSRAAGAKPATQPQEAPRAKPAESTDRDANHAEPHEKASAGAQPERSAQPAQTSAGGGEQASKDSRIDSSASKSPSAQPDIDDGPSRGRRDADPATRSDSDDNQPPDTPQAEKPDADDQPSGQPPATLTAVMDAAELNDLVDSQEDGKPLRSEQEGLPGNFENVAGYRVADSAEEAARDRADALEAVQEQQQTQSGPQS